MKLKFCMSSLNIDLIDFSCDDPIVFYFIFNSFIVSQSCKQCAQMHLSPLSKRKHLDSGLIRILQTQISALL